MGKAAGYFGKSREIGGLQERRESNEEEGIATRIEQTIWTASVFIIHSSHYCLTVVVERFVMWLSERNARGDVLAESRGGKEDRRLKDSFERVFEKGSDFIKPEQFAARLTSRQLKVKSKSNNIAGLQIADLLAHPSYRACLLRHEHQALPDNFGGQIAAILEKSKYHRSYSGHIDGWGRKWLP